MRKAFERVGDACRYVGATAAVLLMSEGAALAQKVPDGSRPDGGIGDMAKTTGAQAGDVAEATKWGGIAIGTLLIGAGLLKLKQAADTQGQQVKYGDGLWRLAVGAGLAGMSSMLAVSQNSMGIEGDTFDGK